MNDKLGDLPEPKTDDIDRAPGGPDATPLESDVGATVAGSGPGAELTDSRVGSADVEAPITPDQPLSAQQEEEKVPDAIQEPEQPEPAEQATDNTGGEPAPSG